MSRGRSGESSPEQNLFQLLQKVLGEQENGGKLPGSGAVPPGGGGGVYVELHTSTLLPPRGVFTKVTTTTKRTIGNFAKVRGEFRLKQR